MRPSRSVLCRFGCGHQVRRFTAEDTGRLVQLDDKPYRGDLTDPFVRQRLWRYRSVWTGWVPVPYLGEEVRVLSHRHAWMRGGHLYTEHDCAKTPKICKPITRPITQCP